ncbi:RagB/SusD family nutrient uptake outer membrane protein [Albibacterium profundi]|uniref:RagB/SusD family nutrient uptake outer membrane protein n=1 Tax=Albibacterium profundi TaxID=3134906 RepID=A0ABV5CKA0_9SPHI
MKKLSKYIIAIGLFASSCSLDRTPYDALPADDLDDIQGSVESITLGNYSRLKDWVNNWHRVVEYPGDNVALSGTTTDNLFYSYNYQRLVTNARVNDFWEQSYKNIVGTNIVLEKLQEGESMENDQLIAENLYLRSMLYFYLTNVFGRPYVQGPENMGVPIKLSSDVDENPARSSVGEVYAQIEKDLLKAESLFNTSKANVYASKEAAQALLARVYLYKGENQKAIEYADKVINSGRFTLLSTAELPNMSVKVPEDNSETIFAIKFVKDADYPNNGWYTVGSMYATIQGAGWGEMYASRPYLELVRKYPSDRRNAFIDPVVKDAAVTMAYYVNDQYTYQGVEVTKNGDDYRYTENGTQKTLIKSPNGAGDYEYAINIGGKTRSVLIDKQLDDRNGYLKYFINKCSGQEGQAHLWSPIISRLAEMYLIRAEANAKLGNVNAALEDVNIIRKRAGIPEAGLYTAASLGNKTALDVVLEERQLELAWEGHRKFDIFRNSRTLNRQYPGTHLSGANPKFTIAPTSPDIVDYIPESQIVISGGVLIQNP